MFILFLLLIFTILYKINFKIDNLSYDNCLSHDKTTMINGIFVVIVFISHISGYLTINTFLDLKAKYFIGLIGQLMVTPFLFFSGYGIYESIKSKKNYMSNFLKNRFLKTYIMFFIAVVLYMIMNFLLNIKFDIKTNLLAFTGYKSIGNSNWFMFCIFCEYIFTYISFKIFKNKSFFAILLIMIFTIVYIKIGQKVFDASCWYDTVLCYPVGMLFAKYKDKIFKILKNKIIYFLSFGLLLCVFLLLYKHQYFHVIFYEIMSICFVLLIILIMLKAEIGNNILYIIGKNTFNIYILQRLSYIFLSRFNINNYVIISLSVLLTIVLVFMFNHLIKFIYKLLQI